MAGDSIGKIFRVTNWGESHSEAIGAVVEGCPPLILLKESDIQKELDRRRPGQSSISSPRMEKDKVSILSGVFEGKTTGAPISLIIFNKDFKKEDYSKLKDSFRPGHADATYMLKYGIRDPFGGGRSSGRLTAPNVAAGAIAKKVLEKYGVEILAYTKQIKNIKAEFDPLKVTFKDIESNIVRCPDKKAANKMIKVIKDALNKGDSVGGIAECVIKNVPGGLGEPIFDKLNADLAKAIVSINAVKGFEIGSGFKCAEMYGSEHNNPALNHAGGILGGISNGMPIIFRAGIKPTPTIGKARGRHDPCIVPRVIPVIEAMAAIVLLDHILRSKTI